MDLNPGAAAIRHLFSGTTQLGRLVGTTRLGRESGSHSFGSASFCHVDGAGSLNHGLLLLSRDTVPQTGQREKEGLCAFVSILKNFSLYNF